MQDTLRAIWKKITEEVAQCRWQTTPSFKIIITIFTIFFEAKTSGSCLPAMGTEIQDNE